jgi:hypothetical protein
MFSKQLNGKCQIKIKSRYLCSKEGANMSSLKISSLTSDIVIILRNHSVSICC